jgi:hypothetical protein
VPSRPGEPGSSRACHGWEKAIGRDGPHAVVTNVRERWAVNRLRVKLPKLPLISAKT